VLGLFNVPLDDLVVSEEQPDPEMEMTKNKNP
jgi:hypothetical protein